jgi:predicted transcriptional regulator
MSALDEPTTDETVTKFELDILRHLNGEETPELRWGAAMSVAIEWLHGGGYVRREFNKRSLNYVITDKGKALLSRKS